MADVGRQDRQPESSKNQLRVLVVEDSLDDYNMIVRELCRLGYQTEALRVHTESAIMEALDGFAWDVVLSDWSMPQLSGLRALAAVRSRRREIPFLFVSDTGGEETAAEAVGAGAHDFLLKGCLARLGVAIERERREASIRAGRSLMEEQLLISNRMASVGILAAGVAHQINNPLSAVIANLDLALDDLLSTRGSPNLCAGIAAALVDARGAAERVRRIVADLQIFSRKQDDVPEPTDVEAVLDATLRMAANEIRHRARLVKDYQPVSSVLGSEARLAQVFLNLVVNAAEALPEGQAARNEIRVSIRERDQMVVVAISDTGHGIPASVRHRIFVPFVTTKAPGVRAGLGLSTCHRIVTNFGGHIRVDSGPSGTTFEVALRATSPRRVDSTQKAPCTATAPRAGRVLVVDDEEIIIRTIERILSPAHHVSGVMSGNSALELIREGARFDVILCDMMMPGLTGMELYRALSEMLPDQADRVVFLTGGGLTPVTVAFLDSVENRRIDKPFEPRVIRDVVAKKVGER